MSGDSEHSSLLGKSTPVPWSKIIPVLLLTFSEAFNDYSLFSYVGYMVLDLMPELKEDTTRLGTFGGILGSAFFFGAFLSSFIWGRLADRFGKKRILLIGTTSTCITTLAFGFSPNYIYAVIMRMLCGLLNGNLGVTKSYLSTVTDSTNQPIVFSLWAFTEGAAGIVGSMVGGFLCRPSEQYPDLFPQEGIFVMFPYFLVNLIAAVLLCFSGVMGLIFLEEINPSVNGSTKPSSSSNKGYVLVGDKDKKGSNNEFDNPDDSNTISLEDPENNSNDQDSSLTGRFAAIKERPALFAAFMYGITGFTYVIYEEIFPIWAIAHIKDGGLDFQPSDIGIVTLSQAITILSSQFFSWKIYQTLGLLKVVSPLHTYIQPSN
eukprot:TRINITY_DN4499_c0_g1_i2.p1 TRINITY_DN4499_c0_g1~~TRINITY_DN4499_c0_g1_i2.p1  ORF type:complete len:375 (-),score=72.57 TRINITY_DN4499_c0_g1_i2:663-1787(-)